MKKRKKPRKRTAAQREEARLVRVTRKMAKGIERNRDKPPPRARDYSRERAK